MSVTYMFRDGTTTTDTVAWARKVEDVSYRVLKQTTLPNGTMVSTVWEGIYSLSNGDRASAGIYETALVEVHGARRVIYSVRTDTEEEALESHRNVVEAHEGVL